MDFITALINLISEIWDRITPYYIVREYEGCVVLRWGKFLKKSEPGFHWKIPFMDEVSTCHTSTETITVSTQSLTTMDNHNIVVGAVVKCSISDAEKYIIKVKDVSNAISDVAQSKIKGIVMGKTWEECRGDIDKEITEQVKKEASKWGIKVEYVTITNLAIIKTIRLIQQ
jgi:regulator of protease activity HflC (stomatin/prohibitin superfamily)